MPSKITLLFNTIPTAGSVLALQNSVGVNGLTETFEALRTTAYQSSIGATLLETALSYRQAFNTDYNGSSLYTTSWDGVLTIEVEHPTKFYFQIGSVINVDENGVSSSDISVSITDTDDPVEIAITDTSFTEATSACVDAQLDVTTDVLAVIYRINGGADVANAANPFNFEYVRGAYINLEVENAEGNTISRNIQFPRTLSASNTTVTYVNSPSGATVTITVINDEGLELTYSLDDVTYQVSNIYSAIVAGDYTAYVKDQLGCSVQVDFTVLPYEDSGGVAERIQQADLPSKSNSIRFAKYVNWGVCSDYKNDENTLSCDAPYTQNPRQANQLFQSCDNIKTQIKSNYSSIVVTIVEDDGTESSIPVDKKSSNLDLKDKRDAIKYDLTNGQTGIYFTTGQTYNYDTGAVTGTYALNGALPAWGYEGNYIFLDAAWFEIVDIIYDDSKSAEVVVINAVYSGSDVSVIVSSVYDAENYEVYEFDIDMSVYNDKMIQVNITETSDNYDDVVFLSEFINIKTTHPSTIEIYYYNDTNTDVVYSTGIKHKIRIPIEYMEGGYNDETSSEETDTTTYLLNAELYELDTFHFQLLTKQLMRKLNQAVSHKFVFMNEVQYVKKEAMENTLAVGTNLFRSSVRMGKSENIYTSEGK
tara:strand:- start:3020 stop:4960 length:1941 start_codon:yes stop_codon:yes gene_type:complete